MCSFGTIGVPVAASPKATEDSPSSGREPRRWRIALDTGGTFTDAIAIAPDGSWHRRKVPSDGSIPCHFTSAAPNAAWLDVPWWIPRPASFLNGFELSWPDGERRRIIGATRTNEARLAVELDAPIAHRAGQVRADAGPHAPLDAPMIAVHSLVHAIPGEAMPPMELRLSTTRGTNALLERRGARTALCITAGFEDLIEIGDQSRPELFARSVRKRAPFCDVVVGVDERMLADGVRRPLTDAAIEQVIASLRAAAVESVAVALVHGLAHPEHEDRLVGALLAAGWRDVVGAGRLSESPRFLSRVETAVVHAGVAPVVRRYLANVAARVAPRMTFMMTSAGGLQRADRYLARDSLLSGPAGGVAGVAELGRRIGRTRLLGIDMGGTSTDVARYDNGFHYRFETNVGGARVAAPALAIESVAAGGGSICACVRGELRVGPLSAGARPGPACYGGGGPLTLTDVNMLLGRMDATLGSIPLSMPDAEAACDALLAIARRERDPSMTRDQLLEALVAIADERMAAAIASVTVREGADPRSYTLVPFGGAGGQHACALADRLGIGEIVFPADAGLLSARGLLGARIERFASRSLLRPLASCLGDLETIVASVEAEAGAALTAEVGDRPWSIAQRMVSVRLDGQEQALELGYEGPATIASDFVAAFERLFGYPPPPRALIVETVRVVAAASSPLPIEVRSSPVVRSTPQPLHRDALAVGASIDGPALLVDQGSTAYLAGGWRATVMADGDLLATRVAAAGVGRSEGSGELDLFACRLESIATSMGELLRRTALSTNVKERLDFSCAVLDARGTLLQNAPHLPVHLGAMGVCVRGVAAALDLRPGDVAVTNHPAFGGSHLPDVTVVTPVFVGASLVGFVANRAHHAEIGGSRPGSFPPDARSLAEEGVVISPMLLVERGVSRFEAIESLLRGGPFPSRAVEENLADLRAAIAANAHGARELAALAERSGPARLATLGEALLDRAERALRTTLAARGDGRYEAIERLDDGTPIAVAVEIRAGAARIDFTGSGPVHRRNFNAPLAIVRAATMYVLRLLVDEDVPMNEGLLRPIELIVPEGFLNPPFDRDPTRSPPVVAGNTETSQRVTDALLRAFGLAACSQGTMNNLLFGNDRYGAYETICGGSGATADADGASAVHTHMTNTRITDPEVLERRCPVVVRTFAVRRGSGGVGRRRGGDGVIREIEFREPAQISLMAQHRVEAPYGIDLGGEGARGRQWHIRAEGACVPIEGVAAIDCAAGEAIRVETPGGGGWGRVR